MRRIGRYQVLGEVARGGMGVVLRGYDPDLDREVAIKLMLAAAQADTQRERRFQVEVRALAKLEHPNVVTVHAFGQHQGRPYLVMDLIAGESLGERLHKGGALAPREAARLALKLAEALQHVHDNAILHRDLKPDNVLLPAANPREPMLTDFGLSKDLDASLTGLSKTGRFMGTPGYLPPEQAHGERQRIGPASDVYGLGATLYEMLTGAPPYQAPDLITLLQAMTKPPALPSRLRPGIDPGLEAICMRCLERRPEERYATAQALATDLERYLEGDRSPETTRWPLWTPLGAGALVVAVLGAGALWVAGALGDPGEESDVAAEVPKIPPQRSDTRAPGEEAEPRAPGEEAEPRAPGEEAEPLFDFEGFVAEGNSRSLAYFERGRLWQERGELDRARVDLERSQACAPANDVSAEDVKVTLGAVLLQLRVRAVEKSYSPVPEFIQPRARPLFERGKKMLVIRNFKAAEVYFKRTLEITKFGAAYLGLAVASSQRLDGHDAALAALEQAIALEPSLHLAYYNRALLRSMRGDVEGALDDLSETIRLAPENLEARMLRVNIHKARKEYASAANDARDARALLLPGDTRREILERLINALDALHELEARRRQR